MKNLELKQLDVHEMNTKEMKNTNGGSLLLAGYGLFLLAGIIWGLCENPDIELF